MTSCKANFPSAFGKPNVGRERHLKGFTLIELLVVVAIISLLVAILLPSLKKAQELARGVICLTQQRSVGMFFAVYANDYDDWVIPAFTYYEEPWLENHLHNWSFALHDSYGLGEGYLDGWGGAAVVPRSKVLNCPSVPIDQLMDPETNKYWAGTTYGLNTRISLPAPGSGSSFLYSIYPSGTHTKYGSLKSLSGTVLTSDLHGNDMAQLHTFPRPNKHPEWAHRHGGNLPVLYADMHGEMIDTLVADYMSLNYHEQVEAFNELPFIHQ